MRNQHSFTNKERFRSKRKIKLLFGLSIAFGLSILLPISVRAEEGQTQETIQPSILSQVTIPYQADINTNHNIEVACNYLNGIVIQPGAEFSYNAALGIRSQERGFVVAPSFQSGQVVTSIGGGICGPSSALYNCALKIGATINERYNHSLQVSYVPGGLDAAVVWGSKDLRFVNPFQVPIAICAAYDGINYTISIIGAPQVPIKASQLRSVDNGSFRFTTYLDLYENNVLTQSIVITNSTYKGTAF